MGSVLSFPVLCFANLLCYHNALNKYLSKLVGKEVRVPVSLLPVLVNGDDIYFKTDDEFYEFWMAEIKIAGFILSLGKNYVHPNTFTINSECYIEGSD